MKTRSIAYGMTTGLIAFVLLSGGAAQLYRAEANVRGMAELGYPLYVLSLIGAWKLLGGLAILLPGRPRLKEWAYAGIVFDLTGAAFSHLAAGHGPGKVLVPLVLCGIALASWALRPAARRLDDESLAAGPFAQAA
jgi:uncharacterized membrane protein YphA (DoxX/SURF4 family)